MAGKIYKLCLCNYAITLGEDFANIDAQFDAILRQPNQLWNDVSACHLQCESKKIPPQGVLTFLIFLTNGWEFLIDFLHTYYSFLSTLDYKFLFNYLQLLRSYAILSATTQFT